MTGNPTAADRPDVWLLVIDDMRGRREKGLAQYGVPVTPDPFTDWLWHHYEELLDAAVYVRAEIEKRKSQ